MYLQVTCPRPLQAVVYNSVFLFVHAPVSLHCCMQVSRGRSDLFSTEASLSRTGHKLYRGKMKVTGRKAIIETNLHLSTHTSFSWRNVWYYLKSKFLSNFWLTGHRPFNLGGKRNVQNKSQMTLPRKKKVKNRPNQRKCTSHSRHPELNLLQLQATYFSIMFSFLAHLM